MIRLDPATVIADLLGAGHPVRFQARGDSMHPLIRDEDALHVEPVGGAPIRRGDVVLVLAERGLTAHRVVGRNGASVLTRGDNAPGDDPAAPLGSVIGRVTWLEREGRRFRVRRFGPVALRVRRWFARAAMRTRRS